MYVVSTDTEPHREKMDGRTMEYTETPATYSLLNPSTPRSKASKSKLTKPPYMICHNTQKRPILSALRGAIESSRFYLKGNF